MTTRTVPGAGRGRLRRAIGWLASAAALLGPAAPATAAGTIDADKVTRAHYGNDAPWYVGRIPLFESADPRLDAVYYYRWSIFRAHQRDLGAEGYISTEFLDDVSWQREPYASLNDATGFHLAEGRWLHDRRFTQDYIDFMYRGGNDRHFTDYMADSVWSRYLVDGDRDAATAHLATMRHIYRLWDDKLDFAKGLYFIEPLLDATEYTVSSIDASGGKDGFRGGDAFRPSINSYQFANARALSRLFALTGDAAASADFARRAADIKARVQADLWNPALGHFTDRYKVDNEFVKYWSPIRARELVGFVPWMFDLPDDTPRFAGAWRHLVAPTVFAGRAGMRTVEPSYQYYMRQYRYLGTDPECQWNGPIWPYQTTQVLAAMANLLDHYDHAPVTRSDYLRLLRQYAALHYQGGKLDLEEDYHPETGRPIVGLDRSHHYFHSGFNDLVLTGLVGIRPRADDVLEVNPLLPPTGDPQELRWFRAQDVPYHGHRVSITWDADGRHYGGRAGLSVEVDGRTVAHRATRGRLTLALGRRANPAIARPINQAVQLVRGRHPLATASSNSDVEALHDGIDGRTWFYPELPNGWTSAGGAGVQWYQIDYGRAVQLSSADIAFFDDGAGIRAPAVARLQAWRGGRWTDIAKPVRPVANGVTTLRFDRTSTERLRLVMTPQGASRIRLAEIRTF